VPLQAVKLVGYDYECDELEALLEGRGKKRRRLPLDDVLSIAPTSTSAQANLFVRAIVPSDDDEGVCVWQYGKIEHVEAGGELARVLFDDKSRATLCVYDLQDARTNRWI